MEQALMSSDKHDWGTPPELYQELDDEFGFTIDVCASDWNAKHENYWTVEDDALEQDWSDHICFMNPPYGREIKHWVEKARTEAENGATVVGLIPARTDTRYWHNHIFGVADDIRFLKGRIKFHRPEGEADAAPFPSAVIVWNSED